MSVVHSIKEKAWKKEQVFVETVDGMSIQEMKDSLLKYAKYQEEVNHFLKTNNDILEAKKVVAELSKPYNDKIKDHKNKLNQLKKLIDAEVCQPELDRVMTEYARLCEQEKMAKEMDAALNEAKNEVKLLTGPSKDTLASLKIKMSYLHVMISEIEGEIHE